jgi:hypothetical protein
MKTNCCRSAKIQKQKDGYICINPDCENYLCSTRQGNSRNWTVITFGFFFALFIILSFNDFSSNSKIIFSSSFSNNNANKINHAGPRPLTKENLKLVLEENKIVCPDQVYAQIMVESGNLESFLARKTNNLLGMRYPAKRATSAVGIYLPTVKMVFKGTQKELRKFTRYNNYAVYENWEDCIQDYKLWQQKCFNLTELYLSFLGDYYAEDSMYVSKIKSFSSN